MRLLLLFVLFFSNLATAQVNMSEQEKIQQQREKNRQEDANRDSALKPNEKPSEPTKYTYNTDSTATFDVDHSAAGYSLISVSENPLTGIKFSGAFTAGFYQEQKLDKRYLLIAGIELPIDIELPTHRIVPFGGAGFQFGTDSAIYGDIGLDFRLVKWFKIQAGVHYPLGKEFYGLFGAALTW